MALLDEKNRHFREMKENLLKTVELAPDYTDARLKLGKVQLLFGETMRLCSKLNLFKEFRPESGGIIIKGFSIIRQKKQPEALAIIDNVLKESLLIPMHYH